MLRSTPGLPAAAWGRWWMFRAFFPEGFHPQQGLLGEPNVGLKYEGFKPPGSRKPFFICAGFMEQPDGNGSQAVKVVARGQVY